MNLGLNSFDIEKHLTSIKIPMNYQEAASKGQLNRDLALAMKAKIEQLPGGIETFCKGIRIESIISDKEYKRIGQFYTLEGNNNLPKQVRLEFLQSSQQIRKEIEERLKPYMMILATGILPDELVSQTAFHSALTEKDFNPYFQRELGLYRYFALTMRDADGIIIGVSGSEVFCHNEGPPTIHGSYCVISPEYRKMGLGIRMVEALIKYSVDFVANKRLDAFKEGRMYLFIEVNDIAKMTLGNRLLDEAMGLHPLLRDKIWEKNNFREIPDINYFQRDKSPIPLALKVQQINIRRTGNGEYEIIGTSPPTEISSDVVLRHVNAFDNLLMNYDLMSKRLHQGGRLCDPRKAGLVTLPEKPTFLATLTPKVAEKDREKWRRIDVALSEINKKTALPLDKTMQELFVIYMVRING